MSLLYLAAQIEGRAYRRVFKTMMSWFIGHPIHSKRQVNCEVWSLSSERDAAEQVASIRSFIRHVGRPTHWNILSDGSHTKETRELLLSVDPTVRMRTLEEILPPIVHLQVQRMMNGREPHVGKKLALEVYLPINGPTIYADSDVVFYPGGEDLAARLVGGGGSPLYLVDVVPALDARLVGPLDAISSPVNAGFCVFFRPPDWTSVLDRLADIDDPGFHQEQSLVHLMMHQEGGKPLDRHRYLLVVDDWSTYRHRNVASDAVLRHYVSTVRHKMWCRIGRSLIFSRIWP